MMIAARFEELLKEMRRLFEFSSGCYFLEPEASK
jgi:hypothetical protein